jgi:hypothetical protein
MKAISSSTLSMSSLTTCSKHCSQDQVLLPLAGSQQHAQPSHRAVQLAELAQRRARLH